MIENFEKETGTFISNILKKTLGGVTENLFQIVNNRILEYQLMIYKSSYLTKSFFHRIKPVPLYDFYMPLSLKEVSHRHSLSNSRNEIATDTCESIFKKSNCITVFGTAGSGKSTLVKHVVIEAIKSKHSIPILIELRELNREEFKGDINKYISSEVFQYYKLATDVNIIDKALTNGGFLFIFDGYDELNQEARSRATSEIKKFSQNYGNNYYLITSRPFTNIENLDGFTNKQINGLTKDEQVILINKLLKDNIFTRERITNEISLKKNTSYLTFLQNPLLLSLFVITFEYHPKLPKKKSLFYDKVFQTLYEKHNSITKVNFTTEFYSSLSEDEFRSVLELYSFITYFHQMYEFTYENIRVVLNEVKKRYSILEIDSSSITKDLIENICIWFKDGDYYSYSHRSLQEYFAAKYILKTDKDTKTRICIFLNEYFKENYNLIELLAEEPDMIYYRIILIPYIRNFLANHFKIIDGKNENISYMLKSFSEFKHLINLDINLSSVYQDFLNRNTKLRFGSNKLIVNNPNNSNELSEVLLINEKFQELEELLNNYIDISLSKNERIMNLAFGKKLDIKTAHNNASTPLS
ncbi:MAG: hypothetical protein DHS20C18_48990 [Saprospiraceae bacterium]|nr:MAG: hypothetical protein DHS20C18_48990 [Saprospiraceae bacterium]